MPKIHWKVHHTDGGDAMLGPTMRCSRSQITGSPLDPIVAVDFLERQACILRHAFAAPDDPAVLAQVSACQSTAHESWLTLTSALVREGYAEVAEEVGSIYGLHGRVAAQLERGVDPRLGPTVARRVRAVLLGELQRRTAAACDRLLTELGAPIDPAGVAATSS